MDNKELIDAINGLIRQLEQHEVFIIGLEAKVEALALTVVDLAKPNTSVIADIDNRFWHCFHSRFLEEKQPSELLTEIHESLSRIC